MRNAGDRVGGTDAGGGDGRPTLVAAARELRDRWLDEVNAGRYLPAATGGKYDVTRRALASDAAAGSPLPLPKLLAA